ncbi:hypothetical protein HOY82DRAFT_552665 [Tuber indicum]|nr:hypothetical protein HOY82DRAFT_552665 [Tuber indicum]
MIAASSFRKSGLRDSAGACLFFFRSAFTPFRLPQSSSFWSLFSPFPYASYLSPCCYHSMIRVQAFLPPPSSSSLPVPVLIVYPSPPPLPSLPITLSPNHNQSLAEAKVRSHQPTRRSRADRQTEVTHTSTQLHRSDQVCARRAVSAHPLTPRISSKHLGCSRLRFSILASPLSSHFCTGPQRLSLSIYKIYF